MDNKFNDVMTDITNHFMIGKSGDNALCSLSSYVNEANKEKMIVAFHKDGMDEKTKNKIIEMAGPYRVSFRKQD